MTHELPPEGPKGTGAILDPAAMGGMFAGFVKAMFTEGGANLADLEKAQAVILDQKEPRQGPSSYFMDPWQLLNFQGARQKQTSLTMAILREMARACKPVAAVIRTRQNQVARFCRAPRYRGDIGFRIRLRDVDAKPTAADKKRILELEKFVLQMGAAPSFDPGGLGKRPGMEAVLRMLVRDTLTLDAIALEPRRDLRNNLFDVWPVDGATIRFVGRDYMPKDRKRKGEIVYLQEYQGRTLTEYGGEELYYALRNPRTDIQSNGYGMSELEELIETITALLNADSYNSRYFTQNSLPEGVLSIVGNLSNTNLEAFKRAWQAQVSGVANAWKVPVVATPDGKGVQFVPFKQSNKDMQFQEYQNLLIMIVCAIYQIDPKEIGFNIDIGQASQLGQASAAPVLEHSQSKGFYPLMTFLETVINEAIVWQLDDRFSFAWEGLDPDREAAQWNMMKEKLQSGVMTPRMYWAEMDIEDPYQDHQWPDCPPNPTLQTVWLQESGLMDQGGDDQGGGQGGDPNDPTAGGAPPDDQGADQ